MLAIAKKPYIQGVLGASFTKSMGYIKDSVEAFELARQQQTIDKLVKAYLALPDNEKSLAISADIVESLLQLKAYKDAVHIATLIGRSVSMKIIETKSDHFNLLRLYSNLAEAYQEAKQPAMARHYYDKALDLTFESEQEADVEVIGWLMSRLG